MTQFSFYFINTFFTGILKTSLLLLHTLLGVINSDFHHTNFGSYLFLCYRIHRTLDSFTNRTSGGNVTMMSCWRDMHRHRSANPSNHETLARCGFDVGSASTTLAQHQTRKGPPVNLNWKLNEPVKFPLKLGSSIPARVWMQWSDGVRPWRWR